MKIILTGEGRISQAITYYLKRLRIGDAVECLNDESQIAKSNLLIGTLASGIGEKSMALALKYRKNLIDLADLDTGFYLKKKKDIEKVGITVIPGCGFCPGLVNFILGYEIENQGKINSIEVEAGSLSGKDCYFPFLWCFEDLVLEFLCPSWQIIQGKRKKIPAFGGYRREKIYGISAETYLAQSGFENLAFGARIKNFTYRNIRPLGFKYFFEFLNNYGLFDKENIRLTKKMLEGKREDNLSLSRIKIFTPAAKIVWQIKSFSKKNEFLNSMQKLTALFASLIAEAMFRNNTVEKGLIFCEGIGKDGYLFKDMLFGLRRQGIAITRRISRGWERQSY